MSNTNDATFTMGPLQQIWIKSLRDHPERQTSGRLGIKTSDGYVACCLGEFLMCEARFNGTELPFRENYISDHKGERHSNADLTNAYERLGLKDQRGSMKRSMTFSDKNYHTNLAELNDDVMSWPTIADMIEKDPTNFFIKSV